MNIRHSVLRNKWKNAGKWQENSSLLQWQCICEHSSNSFPFASLSFASSPIVMKLKIIFFRNGQSCQRANNRLQECDPQYRGAEWAGVTEELPHQSWFPKNEAGLANKPGKRPETMRFCTPAGATETQRGGAASPARYILYFLLRGVQQVQADPMGKPNIAAEVAPCREDRDSLCWPF